MTQIGFTLSEAHQALEEFLNGDRNHDGSPMERWIASGDDLRSPALAYIVPADHYDMISSGYASWTDAQEVREEDADLPPGYRPWRHSPLATVDRLLPVEPLLDPLARIFYGNPFDELPPRLTLDDYESGRAEGMADERGKVEYAAIACLLRVTLDPDGQGAVPVLSVGHSADEPGRGLRWQVAFVTPVPGLYVRVGGNGFFGEEWSVVTGSGWAVRSGYLTREAATTAVEALGRVLPNTDWMRLSPDDFTPDAQKAVRDTLRKYSQWGTAEDQPEPEVMADEVPPAVNAPVVPAK